MSSIIVKNTCFFLKLLKAFLHHHLNIIKKSNIFLLSTTGICAGKPVIIPFAHRNCRKSSKKKTRADNDMDKKTDAEGEPVYQSLSPSADGDLPRGRFNDYLS